MTCCCCCCESLFCLLPLLLLLLLLFVVPFDILIKLLLLFDNVEIPFVVFEAVVEAAAAAAAAAAAEATAVSDTVGPDVDVVVAVDKRLSFKLAADDELGEVDLDRLS